MAKKLADLLLSPRVKKCFPCFSKTLFPNSHSEIPTKEYNKRAQDPWTPFLNPLLVGVSPSIWICQIGFGTGSRPDLIGSTWSCQRRPVGYWWTLIGMPASVESVGSASIVRHKSPIHACRSDIFWFSMMGWEEICSGNDGYLGKTKNPRGLHVCTKIGQLAARSPRVSPKFAAHGADFDPKS